MSDSSYSSVMRFRDVYEIVDDAWLADLIDDDDVEIALGDDAFHDEGDMDSGDVLEAATKEDERWTDLALEHVTDGGSLQS
mmetsp:Transcript_4666/g.14800  ORF Transcript_4666/g.14800 Transcript_4666/m.14800 type:complete len:81 (-) Transcript_4666:69-311(-)|eukprot:CAMPEP_0184117170 /NCGR_PEP_ID=MMETSP0974-20121125/20800_1 /TAXON_ID=483370 /ORGANISM="non described non described, Strain CCMP2097" /LENGTH=80 /DNA_ID=CAMNT_0026420301 /DNA_START=92 /DNA_END=334 /DNA_ORIENTATION=+